tara:strand:+ start:922 stop:2076 length:1155 start_codon:yes stop_codon:yes gene_type:complete
MSDDKGGPWGGKGGGDNKGGDRGPWGGGNRGQNGGGNGGGQRPPNQMPDLDRIVKKGQEQLRVLMGGGGGGGNGEGAGPGIGRGAWFLVAIAAVGVWLFMSFYTVKPEEQSVELTLGEFSSVGEPGLNFAPWPIVTAEILPVTRENIEDIGVGNRGNRSEDGLMLTGDENIVDIDFQVVWNISDPAKFLFNLADPRETIRAVAESAMREVIGRSQLAPILNRDRSQISDEVEALIQATLDSYDSGVNIVRLNLDKADPPREVIDSFRDVQAAEQERDTLEKQADAYANQAVAEARGQAAQLLEEAEGYRAQIVNSAQGEASRFLAVLEEYLKAPEVTRQRLYLETLERVMGSVQKVIIDSAAQGGQGVVPYLPLSELRSGRAGQ